MEPRYFTVNITVENEVGELFAVWRTDEPYDNVETAIERALILAETSNENADVGEAKAIRFDRMDDA